MDYRCTAMLLAVYCLLILAASLVGGWIPLVLRLTHERMELAVSFVAGLMLGVGVLHLLPHAVTHLGPGQSIDQVTWPLLAGFLAMFFIERFFCFHHHDPPDENHAHAHHHHHETGEPHHHDLKWSGAAIGLSIHSLIEGVALATSVHAEANHQVSLAGLGTFLVIFFHKPFDSLTLGTLLARNQRNRLLGHIVNLLFALVVLAGVALFEFGISRFEGDVNTLLVGSLAFSAGTFLCIAMSDLLPELQFHQHDRGKLSLALLAGLIVAAAVGLMESRGHGPVKGPDQSQPTWLTDER
jgi:zinc and cadmium transporter